MSPEQRGRAGARGIRGIQMASLAAALVLFAAACGSVSPSAPPTQTPPITLALYRLDNIAPTATDFHGRPFLRWELSDVVLINDPGLPEGHIRESLEAFRTTWQIMEGEFGVEQRISPPTLFLTKSYDTMQAATDREMENPGWLTGFASLNTSELYVIAQQPTTYHTIGHEATHLGMKPDLPWLAEGLADYMGFGVEISIDSGLAYQSMLNYRTVVRKAAAGNSAFTLQDLLEWEWSRLDREEVQLFYAQSWWFVDYLVTTFGSGTMGYFLTELDRTDAFDDAFLEAFGVKANAAFADFLQGFSSNRLPEERIADSVLSFLRLGEEHTLLRSEWNALAATRELDDATRVAWRELADQYGLLSKRAAQVEAEGPVLGVRDGYVEAFRLFSQVATVIAEDAERERAAAAVTYANGLTTEAYSLLIGLYRTYPWGVLTNQE